MLQVTVTYRGDSELGRVVSEEMRRGVMLAKIEPPADLEFRHPLSVELRCGGRSMRFASEVVSILPGVGVAMAFPPEKLEEARALLAAGAAEPTGETTFEAAPSFTVPVAAAAPPAPKPADTPAPAAPPVSMARASFAEKVQYALHGSRDDRAAILRDQNKQLHPFVLKSPTVTPEEVAGWAANAQMSPDFLKQISERKEWFSRPAIAVALARNPKTPPEVAIKAVDYIPAEALRQMAKGVGALPHVVQAARKKILPR